MRVIDKDEWTEHLRRKGSLFSHLGGDQPPATSRPVPGSPMSSRPVTTTEINALLNRANNAPGEQGRRIRRGLYKMAAKVKTVPGFKALGRFSPIPGTFLTGLGIGTALREAYITFKTGKGSTTPAGRAMYSPIDQGDVILSSSGSGGGVTVHDEALAPSMGYQAKYENAPGTSTRYFNVPDECGDRVSSTIPPFNTLGGIPIDVSHGVLCYVGGQFVVAGSQVSSTWFVPADVTFDSTDKSDAPENSRPGTSLDPEDADLDRDVAALENDPVRPRTTDEEQTAIDWIGAQPEAGLSPATMPETDPLTDEPPVEPDPEPEPDPDGAEVQIPAWAPTETWSVYNERLRQLHLLPQRDELTDAQSDPDLAPEAIVRVDPPPGTKVREGTTVRVRTNSPTPSAGGAGCEPWVRPALDFGPILAIDMGDQFPFGIPAWIEDAVGQLSASRLAPRLAVPMPGGIGDMVIDGASVAPVVNELRPWFLVVSLLLLVWVLASATLGFRQKGTEAAE